MSRLWEHSPRVLCTHPGWSTLRGWGQVSAAFFALFANTSQLQFVLTRQRAEVEGDVGWVSVDENLLGDQGGNTVAALNVFAYDDAMARWRLVCHHGSVVNTGIEAE
jgi:hypothetical protein